MQGINAFKLLGVISLALFLTYCGKSKSDSDPQPTAEKPVSPTPTPTRVAAPAPKVERKVENQTPTNPKPAGRPTCDGFNSEESGLKYSSNKDLDLAKEMLQMTFANGASKSLCTLLAESKAKVITMQFSGVYCTSCQTQAKDIGQKYATTALGKSAKHVVVFIDAPDGGNDESEFDNFMTTYAASAVKSFDGPKALYKKLVSDPANVKFGVALAFNGYGDIYVQENAEGGELDRFLAEVNKLSQTK